MTRQALRCMFTSYIFASPSQQRNAPMKIRTLKNCLPLIVALFTSLSSAWEMNITNPAVNACRNAGGVTGMIQLTEGEMPICAFGKQGNSVISSWAIVYTNPANRDENQEVPAATKAFFSASNKIPTSTETATDDWQSLAKINCRNNLEGEVRNVSDPDGKEYTICFFPEDQSAIDITTLLLGPDENGPNRLFVKMLKNAMGEITQ